MNQSSYHPRLISVADGEPSGDGTDNPLRLRFAGNTIAAMLTALSILLIVLGVSLNRMANHYFRRHALPAEVAAALTLRQKWRRWPRQLLALFSYLLGFVLIVYGASNLLG